MEFRRVLFRSESGRNRTGGKTYVSTVSGRSGGGGTLFFFWGGEDDFGSFFFTVGGPWGREKLAAREVPPPEGGGVGEKGDLRGGPVRAWESQFWKQEVEPNVFLAPIDTTFAVYKPYFKGELIDFDYVYFRTGFPYSVRHLAWYVDSGNPSEEERYYIGHLKTSTHWSEQSK